MKSILLLAYLSWASAAVPIFIGFLQWKRLQGYLKLILFIPVASGLADIVSLILMNYQINTWTVINLFFIVAPFMFLLIGAQSPIGRCLAQGPCKSGCRHVIRSAFVKTTPNIFASRRRTGESLPPSVENDCSNGCRRVIR